MHDTLDFTKKTCYVVWGEQFWNFMHAYRNTRYVGICIMLWIDKPVYSWTNLTLTQHSLIESTRTWTTHVVWNLIIETSGHVRRLKIIISRTRSHARCDRGITKLQSMHDVRHCRDAFPGQDNSPNKRERWRIADSVNYVPAMWTRCKL